MIKLITPFGYPSASVSSASEPSGWRQKVIVLFRNQTSPVFLDGVLGKFEGGATSCVAVGNGIVGWGVGGTCVDSAVGS